MQTVASAAGTFSSIIFVLPGLVIVGLLDRVSRSGSRSRSAPRRHPRRDVHDPAAPRDGDELGPALPEGVACAEVLKVGIAVTRPSTAAERVETRAALACRRSCGELSCRRCSMSSCRRKYSPTPWPATSASGGARSGATGFDFSLSFAFLAIGHLVGLSVGIAMLIGTRIGWAWAVPYFTRFTGHRATAADAPAPLGPTMCDSSVRARSVCRQSGRCRSWSSRSSSGLAGSIRGSARAKGGHARITLPSTERDIPIGIVGSSRSCA